MHKVKRLVTPFEVPDVSVCPKVCVPGTAVLLSGGNAAVQVFSLDTTSYERMGCTVEQVVFFSKQRLIQSFVVPCSC